MSSWISRGVVLRVPTHQITSIAESWSQTAWSTSLQLRTIRSPRG